MSFTPYDRPVRAAFVGLGRIYDLNMRAYVDNPDVEVIALVDPNEARCAQRRAGWLEAATFTSTAELAASGMDVDAIEALLPISLHADGVIEMLGNGWHVNLSTDDRRCRGTTSRPKSRPTPPRGYLPTVGLNATRGPRTARP